MKLQKALPGVRVDLYQAYHGSWHGTVKLDQQVYPDESTIPTRHRKQLHDGQHNAWHYNIIVFPKSHHRHHPAWGDHGVPRDEATMIEVLDCEVADLLMQLLAVRKRNPVKVFKMVQKLPHRRQSSRLAVAQ